MQVNPLNSAKSVLLTIQQPATQPPSCPFCSLSHLNVCRSRCLTIQYMFCGNSGNFRHHLSMFCLQAMRLVVRYIVDGTPSNEFVFSVVTLPPCILHRMVVQQENGGLARECKDVKFNCVHTGSYIGRKTKNFSAAAQFLTTSVFQFHWNKILLVSGYSQRPKNMLS